MATLPKFDETEPLPSFESTEGLPAFEDTAELPSFDSTEPAEEETGALEAGARGLAQGALFEFADEAEAGGRALIGQNYKQELDRIRAQYKKAEEDQPAASLAGNLVGAVGTAFIPGIGAIGNVAKGANAARVAGAAALQGGLTGLGRSKKEDVGETVKDVATEAAAGAVLGTALHGVVSGAKALAGKLKKVGNLEADVDLLKMADTTYAPKREGDGKFAAAIHEGAVPTDAEDIKKLEEFAYYLNNPSTTSPEAGRLSAESAQEILETRRAQMSQADFTKAYQNYRELQAFKGVARGIIRKEPGIVENIRDGLNSVIDGTYVARDVDKRTGTSISEVLLDGTENINKYQVDLARWIKAKQGLTDLGEKESQEVYAALDTGAPAKPELQETVQKWKKFYSDAADYVKELGVPIQKMENYVPKKMVGMADAIVRVKSKVAELGGPDAVLAKLGSKEAEPLEKAVAYFNGGKSLSSDPKAFMEKLHDMQMPGSDAFLKEKVASGLFRREGLLPDFLQEKDLRKLSNSWLMESLRYGHMKGTLDELSRQRDLLKVAGAESDVAWMDNLVNDYLGGARGLAKVTRNGTAYLQVKALEAAKEAVPGTLKHSVYKHAAETPDALQNMVMNVYPNFLGMSPRAMVQNIAGGFYTMMPELGLTYGATRGLDAYKRAVQGIAKDRKGYFKSLEKSGFIAPQWTTDLKEALKTGTPKTGAGRAYEKTKDNLSEWSMKGFEASEKINRAVAYETGKLLTKDLIIGGDGMAAKSARNFLSTMPPSMARRATALVAAGDSEALEKLVTKYFADRTLFSYNRLTQSELARAVGPLFSMFTKFPASVLGGVVAPIRERGAEGGAQVTRKLMAPYIAGSLLNNLVFDEDSPTAEYLFGKQPEGKKLGRGLASASPVGALSSIAGGRVFTPPVVGTVKELGSALIEGDPARLERWAKGTAQAFAPGGSAAYYRFLKQHAELGGLIEDDD